MSDEPSTNVLAGARYLRLMLDRFSRTDLALAAYNAGPTVVERSAARRAARRSRTSRTSSSGGPRSRAATSDTHAMVYAVVLAPARRRATARRRRSSRCSCRSVLDAVGRSAVDGVVVVAGAHPLDVESVELPRLERGPGASLRCGLAALPAEAEAAVVVLADGPGARSARRSTGSSSPGGPRAATSSRPRTAASASHPVLLARAAWAASRTRAPRRSRRGSSPATT